MNNPWPTFGSGLLAFLTDRLGALLIPNWNRVESAMPTLLDELREVVRQDNEELRWTALRTSCEN